jgi:type II secretory pathway pseudopilin PulG
MRARHRCPPRAAQRGFTLVELTVSLLAGLLVAMGIVALSREATRTFHEEVRSSAAEAALRAAADRLRADLERAGFMSTGNIAAFNIAGAPRIAHPRVATANVPTGAPAGLQALMSLSLNPGGSVTANGLPLSAVQPQPLTPDILQISGNMTSADQFEIASYQANYQQGCTRIWLVSNSPAIYRVIGSPQSSTADADVRALFLPMGANASTPFMVRVVDTSGCAQYLETCTLGGGAGMDGANPYVDISANTPLVTAAITGNTCGVTGFGEGSVLNPIQTVQWEITTQSATGDHAEPAAYTSSGFPVDATKYDLMRTFYDATGHAVANSSEIIAEYAVDLSFAFSVDQGTALAPSIATFPFDDPNDNSPWADPKQITINHGPERIRSVQARIVTRASQADRSVQILLPTGGANYTNPSGSEKFAYRYCMQGAGCPASNPTNAFIWARTRTIVIEAALPNQAGNFY